MLIYKSLEFPQYSLFSPAWKTGLSVRLASQEELRGYFCCWSSQLQHNFQTWRSSAHVERRNGKVDISDHNSPVWPPRTAPCWSGNISQTPLGQTSSEEKHCFVKSVERWQLGLVTSSSRLDISSGVSSVRLKYSSVVYSLSHSATAESSMTAVRLR